MEAGLAFPCVCDTASLPHLNIYLPCIRNICYVLLGTSSKLYHWPDLSIMTDHADLSSQNPKRCIYILALQQVQASAPMSLKLYHPGIFLDLSTSRTNSFSLLRHPSAVSCPYPYPLQFASCFPQAGSNLACHHCAPALKQSRLRHHAVH